MGIQNYHKFIRSVYKESHQKKWLDSYDNIYFDLNFILHRVGYVATSQMDIVNKLKEYINNVIKITNPKKRVIFTADGPAPLAKLFVQRKRRLNMVRNITSNNNDDDNDDDDNDNNNNNNLDDTSIESSEKETTSLNFTAGTKFMMELEKSLRDYIAFLKIIYNLEIITDIIGPDEAELKIKYNLNIIQGSDPLDTHLVISGDSDMIVLLATCLDLNLVYVMVTKEEIIYMGKLMDSHTEIYGRTANYKEDFTFVNMLMGNDYIPKTNYLNFEKLWDAYKIVHKSYPDGIIDKNREEIKINVHFLHDLIYYTIKNIGKAQRKKAMTFNLSDLCDPLYDNYIKGLIWSFEMYRKGVCHCYQYFYNHHGSPHPLGIVYNIMINSVHQLGNTSPINPNVYAILLIPEQANYLLGDANKDLSIEIAKKNPILYEEERCTTCKKMYLELSKIPKNDNDKRNIKIKKLSTHKLTHSILTIDDINKIQKSYFKLAI